jgi:hypothetical protein
LPLRAVCSPQRNTPAKCRQKRAGIALNVVVQQMSPLTDAERAHVIKTNRLLAAVRGLDRFPYWDREHDSLYMSVVAPERGRIWFREHFEPIGDEL